MLAYSKCADPVTAYKIFREIKEKGIEPSAATYTTLIQGYKKVKNY